MSDQRHSMSPGRKKRRIIYRLAGEPTTGLVFAALGSNAFSPGASPPGTAVQFTDKGAQKLTNVRVVKIFWGRE